MLILTFLFWTRHYFLNYHQCDVIVPICFLMQEALDAKGSGHISELRYAEPFSLTCEQRLKLEGLYHTSIFCEEVLL